MQANPSLQGQTLYTKGDAACLANMDKQIFRLIGKATTLAASVFPLLKYSSRYAHICIQDGVPCPPRQEIRHASRGVELHWLVRCPMPHVTPC